jgi:hypothetical protein
VNVVELDRGRYVRSNKVLETMFLLPNFPDPEDTSVFTQIASEGLPRKYCVVVDRVGARHTRFRRSKVSRSSR